MQEKTKFKLSGLQKKTKKYRRYKNFYNALCIIRVLIPFGFKVFQKQKEKYDYKYHFLGHYLHIKSDETVQDLHQALSRTRRVARKQTILSEIRRVKRNDCLRADDAKQVIALDCVPSPVQKKVAGCLKEIRDSGNLVEQSMKDRERYLQTILNAGRVRC